MTQQLKSRGRIARLNEVHQLFKNEKPDVVYTWGNGESLITLVLQPLHKYKFINGSVRHGIRGSSISHYLRTIVLHLSPFIVANSYAGLKANRIKHGQILYNGIEAKFLDSSPNRSSVSSKLSTISKQNIILISVANLVPYKDYFSILNALKKLKDENYFFNYLILGDGPMRELIQNKITKLKLDDNIQIIGNVSNVSDYLKISDVFIHSSKGEGCSNAILEAMAAGLPIIATNTGGTSEIVNHLNGYLYDYKDHTQLFQHIKHCLNNTIECREKGASSAAIVKERFSVKIMMSKYYSILSQVTNK